MDQSTALKLFDEGAVLFFLDAPVGTEFGIDFNSWNTGEKFKGIKMIPPGIHFVFYSAVSKEGSVAPRTGFFHNFKKKEILFRKWHPDEEDIKDSCSEDEKERLSLNIRNLDQNLGPYPFDSWKKWVSLSNKLTAEVVGKINPADVKIGSVADLIPCDAKEEEPTTKKSKRVLRASFEDALLPTMHARPGTALNFTSIPEVSYPQGASTSEITRYSIDTSHVLRQMLLSWKEPVQLLGELQMAFLCFLIGQVYTAFEHWKKMIHILCSADEYLMENPILFFEFSGDLYFQMQEVPPDFFVDIVSQDNFLTQTLKTFFENVLDNDRVDEQLKKRCSRLKHYVTERFHWDFEAEREDEAPAIVECTAEVQQD